MKNARITKLKVKKKKGYYQGGEADPNSLYNNINKGQSQQLNFQGAPVDPSFNIQNTSSLASTGSMFGPEGTAIGAGLGLGLDVMNYNKNKKQTEMATNDIRDANKKLLDTNNVYNTMGGQGYEKGGMPGAQTSTEQQEPTNDEDTSSIPTDQGLFFEFNIADVPELKNAKKGDFVDVHGVIDIIENGKGRIHLTDFMPSNEKTNQEIKEEGESQEEEGTEYVAGGVIYEYKKGGWIQKATASIKRRGTKGKCTPITKPGCTGRARALALTFKKMAKNREEGGSVGKYDDGGKVTPDNISPKLRRNVYTVIANNPTHNTETPAMKQGGQVPGELKVLFDKCMAQAGGDKNKAMELVKQYLKKK